MRAFLALLVGLALFACTALCFVTQTNTHTYTYRVLHPRVTKRSSTLPQEEPTSNVIASPTDSHTQTQHTPKYSICAGEEHSALSGAKDGRTLYTAKLNGPSSDSLSEILFTAYIASESTGPVPRSGHPSALVLRPAHTHTQLDTHIHTLLQRVMRWYADSGGRASRLYAVASAEYARLLESVGFDKVLDQSSMPSWLISGKHVADGDVVLLGNAKRMLGYVEQRVMEQRTSTGSEHDVDTKASLLNLLGRLRHENGMHASAVEAYTRALEMTSRDSAIFRNLGAAYCAQNELQMGFASYQQALSVNPDDGHVYLKLAFLYEELANKEWKDDETDTHAGQHAISCYNFYLDRIDGTDPAILTRLGNQQIKQLDPEAAVTSYRRAVELDPSLYNVWFNMAQAQIKIGDEQGAVASLEKTLSMRPDLESAKHMLAALTKATEVNEISQAYVKELFDSYAETYDKHLNKKLLYSAPRVIRMQLAEIFKETYGESYSAVVNKSINFLDLGCGTGLTGAWMKDYARRLVGVDLSDKMATVAKKKAIYDEVHVMNMNEYLSQCGSESFEVVVAADVLSYVGALEHTFRLAADALVKGGLFAFTIEASPSLEDDDADRTIAQTAKERGYALQPTGRFGYTREYVDKVAESVGLRVCRFKKYSPRLEAGEPIPGYLYVLTNADTITIPRTSVREG